MAEKIDTAEQSFLAELVQANVPTRTALDTFVAYLSRKYDLGPQDMVNVQGQIVRHVGAEHAVSDPLPTPQTDHT